MVQVQLWFGGKRGYGHFLHNVKCRAVVDEYKMHIPGDNARNHFVMESGRAGRFKN